MSLMNFPPAVKTASTTQQIVTQAPVVTETVRLSPEPSQSRTDLLRSEDAWGWSEVRDYVVSEIEARFGAFPRDSKKEYGIFNRFCRTFGSDAPRIARYAFEVADGRWKGSPIGIQRFCKGSDAWFSEPILERLNDR